MLLSPMNPTAFQPTLPSLQQIYSDPLQHHMPASKRPKLSLQTSLPTVPYGVSSSQAGSNRVETLATPTTRNTVANQYHTFDLSIRPSPVSTTGSPAPAAFPKPGPTSRNKRSLPYDLNLPIGKRSILKNSSITTDVRRGSLSAAASASPRSASGGRRVFFPEPKRVKFGSDEEIVTSTYLARHVDLSSSEDETSLNGSDDGINDANETQEVSDDISAVNKLSRRKGETVVVDELQRGRSTGRSSVRERPTTRKKRRWEWTLGGTESRVTEPTVAGAEEPAATPQPEQEGDEVESPSNASTSSSPSIATPSTPFAVEAKHAEVMINEVVPTPTSATGELHQCEKEPVSKS